MTLDELNALAEEQGIPGDAQIIARVGEVVPGETFEPLTLEGLTMNNHGQVRLILEYVHDDDLEV